MQSKWPNSVSIKFKNDNNFDFIENFTGFGKLQVSSDHENYYSWNKSSMTFSEITQSVGDRHYIIALHIYNMRKLLIKSLNLILYFI